MEFDTCPAESNHRFTKEEGKKTQRIKSKFESQTATRIYERNVIYTAYDDSQMKNFYSNNKVKNNDDNKLFGQFHCKLFAINDDTPHLSFMIKCSHLLPPDDYGKKLRQDTLKFLDDYFSRNQIYDFLESFVCYKKYK